MFFSYWLTFGDEFHVTKSDLLAFCFPFKSLSKDDKIKLLNLAKKFIPESERNNPDMTDKDKELCCTNNICDNDTVFDCKVIIEAGDKTRL